MAQISDILSRVRTELGDIQKNFTFAGYGDGATTDFYLNTKPVELTNLYVTIDAIPVAYPSGYTVEQSTGTLMFTTPPVSGAAIAVEGLADRYFLDADLTTYINDAVNQHTYNRVDAFGSQVTIASITPVEEYPVAILASIEALWALATDAAFDINITAPDGVVIPRAERFQQLSSIISQRWDQYRMLCSQLNVGLWKIEMGTLVRVSRMTNKYVPVFMPQEIDDSRLPERVYITNNLTGRSIIPTYAQVQDIELYQGNSFREEFTFPFDITGLNFAAQIRTYPNSPSLYATFDITVVSTSSTASTILLELDNSDTQYMPVRAFWDLTATSSTDSTYAMTYIRGQVFTTQAVTIDTVGTFETD